MSTAILRKFKVANFTVLHNEIFENSDLSFKATGIFCYLMSLPDDWEINMTDLAQRKADGKGSVRTGVDELIEAGFVRRVCQRDESGRISRWEIQVRESVSIDWEPDSDFQKPDTDFPDVDNPDVENPDVENCTQLNTNSTKYLDEPSTKETKTGSQADDVQKIWSAYVTSVIDTLGKRHQPRPTKARLALIARRLKEYDVEELLLAVTGWTKSDFHMGNNENGVVYNKLELILRNAEKIESFIGYHENRKPTKNLDKDWDDWDS